jgi:hypothetical protein
MELDGIWIAGYLRSQPSKRSTTMPSRIRNYIKLLAAFCLIASFCLVEVDAQSRRKRRNRRAPVPAAPRPVITNPPIAPPEGTQNGTTVGDVKIISTDDPEK